MGYSHYYKFRTDYKISSLKWKEIVDDFNKILDVEVDIPRNDLYSGTEGLTRLRSILEPDSDQRLEITDSEIRFNGREEGDRGHETFSIQRGATASSATDSSPYLLTTRSISSLPFTSLGVPSELRNSRTTVSLSPVGARLYRARAAPTTSGLRLLITNTSASTSER